MRKIVLAAALAASFGLSGAAMADGMPSRAPKYIAPEPVATTWTGFYVGVGFGAGALNHDIKANIDGFELAEVDGLGGEGVFGTVTVGYDHQFGRFVGGIFFDYDFSNIGSTIRVAELGSADIDLNNMWSIGGRLGYLVTPNTLLYGLVAYTQANFDFPSGLKNDTFSGVSVGGGLETQLGGNWFLKGEYRFTSLDKETIFDDGYGFRVTDEPDIHTARLVLSYKFNALDGGYAPLK